MGNISVKKAGKKQVKISKTLFHIKMPRSVYDNNSKSEFN